MNKKIYVQLLQLSDFTLTKIILCKVEVDRKIEYCGMHSHTSTVINGYRIHYPMMIVTFENIIYITSFTSKDTVLEK